MGLRTSSLPTIFVQARKPPCYHCHVSSLIRSISSSVQELNPASCERHQDSDSKKESARQDDLAGSCGGDGDGDGAMSRRLAEMTEQAMLEDGPSTRRNIQEEGFSEELKRQLGERIAAGTTSTSSFRSEHAAAFSIVEMPSAAGQGTRDIAAASPWTGAESLHDTTLRMLNDSKKPEIRVPYKIPRPTPIFNNIHSAGPRVKSAPSTGHRLADARDRSSTYILSQSPALTDEERESVRKELRHRFEPDTRSMSMMTIQGLTSLANERIEDAMARGLFKNIPRGQGQHVQTDHNANSAFIDTTEYFMNKIIQKQEIVPPWIEKQQDLAGEIARFRRRLRSDWKRHAARLIASQGGSLAEQITRARVHAIAESRLFKSKAASSSSSAASSINVNPNPEQALSQIDHEGRLLTSTQPSISSSDSGTGNPALPNLAPLRDPAYLSIERAFHELQIKAINDLTRSYNLQAPRVAQKPYLNLERELNSCYSDVAPSLADEIVRRTTDRTRKAPLLDLLTAVKPKTVRVYDEHHSKGYGFRELWRDLWGKKQEKRTN